MAKKSKKNLQQRLKKKQQLQQSHTGTVIPTAPTVVVALPKHEPLPALNASRGTHELWRTIISLIVIAALLGGTVIFDRQNNHLDTVGNWIFTTLRLDK